MSDPTTEDFHPAAKVAASPSYPAVNPGQDGELRREADELQPYEAMPLVVKSRRVPSTKSGLDAPTVLQSLQHSNVEQLSDPIQLLYDSGIRARDFFRAEGKLKQSFSNISYADLVPFFDIPNTAADIPEDIQLYRCRLPLDVIKKTAELV